MKGKLMTVQTYDAHGNQVTGESGTCARCGQTIKHIYHWNGQTYGERCIGVVTGSIPMIWVREGNHLHLDQEAQRAAEAELAARLEANRAAEAQRQAIKTQNQVTFAGLLNVLDNASQYHGDFCAQMADYIRQATYSTDLWDILSSGQYNAVRDIWAKRKGRRGSKAYQAALDEFDRLYDTTEEAE